MWSVVRSWFAARVGLRFALQSAVCLGIICTFIASPSMPAMTPLPAKAFDTTADRRLAPKALPPRTESTKTPTASPSALRASLNAAATTPTASPVPNTPAPVRISRSPRVLDVDSNTLALFHFDNQVGASLLDVTGNYTATIHGNITLTPGLFDKSLLTSATGYVTMDSLGAMTRGTIELYVDFQPACRNIANPTLSEFTIVSMGGNFGSGIYGARIVENTSRLDFEILTATGWVVASSGINACRYLNQKGAEVWPYETVRFHHVAATWGPRGMEIWVDGVLHGITHPDFFINGLYNPDYECNPQSQIASRYYPYCETPILGRVDYPKVYQGAIPAHTTVLIGCDPSGNPDTCFVGRLDDLRISDIQRTFTVDVVPPSTPTPTNTPVAPVGEYTADANTVALYHLNALNASGYVPDATAAQHHGRLMGQASLVSTGHFNGSLKTSASNAYVKINDINPWSLVNTGTVEAWVNLNYVSAPFSVLSAGPEPGASYFRMSLGMPYAGSTLRFGIWDGWQIQWADSGVTPADLGGCWHFLAGTWGARGVEIWVDGVKRGTNSFTNRMEYWDTTYLIGCDGKGMCMPGYIDEVRFSGLQRTFTTPRAPARAVAAPTFQPTRVFAPAASGNALFLPFVQIKPAPVCPYG